MTTNISSAPTQLSFPSFCLYHFDAGRNHGTEVSARTHGLKKLSRDGVRVRVRRSWLKKIRLRLVFSTHLSVFEYLMKHFSLCLIYYIKSARSFRYQSILTCYLINEIAFSIDDMYTASLSVCCW